MESAEQIPLLGSQQRKASFITFLAAFWPLSLISFGGPQAHVALMHDKFVDGPLAFPSLDKPYVPEPLFLELYALAQSLPGPGSTQLAASIGATFGGATGAAVTFLVWHLPGFIIMTSAGLWFHSHLRQDSVVLIQTITDHAIGLISAAYAFVLLAAFKIVSKTCNSNVKMGIALISMFVAVTIPPVASSWIFIALLVGGGLSYYTYDTYLAPANSNEVQHGHPEEWESHVSPKTGTVLLVVVAIATVIIALLPSSDLGFRVLRIFWRIGLCVFGGGIIVVPMLLNEFVESKLLPTSVFLAGFGLFGCIPGPMFNLAPFLGAAVVSLKGAFFGSFGLFGPGLLLQVGLLPFWERIRRIGTAQTILQGTNSAAAGLIVAGVWMLLRRALVGPAAFALTCTAGAASLVYHLSPATNIVLHGVAGIILVSLGIGGPFHVTATKV